MIFFSPIFKKKSGFWVFSVHPAVVSVLLSASVKICFVSHMRNLFLKIILIFVYNNKISYSPWLLIGYFQMNLLQKNYPRRPCKIWPPYGSHCVEKSLVPKLKNFDTPKPGSINCHCHTIPMVQSL